MYECTLFKTNTGGSRLRSKAVSGITGALPTPGLAFQLLGEPLSEEAGVRVIVTSPVKSVTFPAKGSGKKLSFTTVSGSVYELEYEDLRTEQTSPYHGKVGEA